MNNDPPILLSVVIPAYNEEARIGCTLERVSGYLEGRDYAAEILVVDDGSADGTREVAGRTMAGSAVPFRLLALPANRGKGAAVREGVLAARGEFVLFSDADLSTPIEEADRLLARQRETGADAVLGSRALPDSRITRPQGRLRQLAGKTFNRMVRLLTGLPFRDTQCGFKLFRAAVARELFSRLEEERFAFDVEIVYRAMRRGCRVIEVPVEWADDRRSRVRFFRDSARMAVALLRIRRAKD
jgi:glycosyltransferase involved in cell wall biosynthesis